MRQAAQLKDFAIKSQTSLKESSTIFTEKLQTLQTKSEASVAENDAKTKGLIEVLDGLENRIKESIERATGYTLFHSFQKRQEDIAKSKRFWAYALGAVLKPRLADLQQKLSAENFQPTLRIARQHHNASVGRYTEKLQQQNFKCQVISRD